MGKENIAGENNGGDTGAQDQPVETGIQDGGADNGAQDQPAKKDIKDAGGESGKAGDAGGEGKGKAAGDGADNGKAGPDPDDSPITDWGKVDLGLPEGVSIEPELMESLGKAMIASGISPKQARELARWNLEAIGGIRERQLSRGMEELRKAWGDKAEANRVAALGVVTRIDREMARAGLGEGAFSKALADSGAAFSPAIVRALHVVSQWLSEDSAGSQNGARMEEKPETALEGLNAAFKMARNGK